MDVVLSLRPVTMQDAAILLEWRNESATLEASHTGTKVTEKEHLDWLQRSMIDPNRKLYIAENDTGLLGTVRADLLDGVWVLSWSVAAEARGRGIGKTMVGILVDGLSGSIRAEVKVGNNASVRVAEYVGMRFDRLENGILYYSRLAEA